MKDEELRVLMIASNVEVEPYPVYPLGAAVLAGCLQRQAIAVTGLDFTFLADPSQATKEAITRDHPDLVAISIRAVDSTCSLEPKWYLPPIRELVATVKESTDAPVVCGGAGLSLYGARMLKYLEADYGVVGEGERTLLTLIDALRHGRAAHGIPGVVTTTEHASCHPPAKPLLQEPPWQNPAYEVFPLEPYLAAGGMASVQTKRGCPMGCTYCTYPLIEGTSLRLREPRDVAAEVTALADRGVDYVFFVDNNFNIPASHALEVCQELISHRAATSWTAFLTPHGIDGRLVETMARAGARSVELGSEAGAPETLMGLGKQHTADDIVNSDHLCTEHGVTPAHYFIFGGPGETHESVQRSLDLIDTLQGPCVATLGIRVYPGTALQERAVAEGQLTAQDDLLAPAFFISGSIDPERVLASLQAFADQHKNFILLGAGTNIDRPVIQRLRQRGYKGPMWELLAR